MKAYQILFSIGILCFCSLGTVNANNDPTDPIASSEEKGKSEAKYLDLQERADHLLLKIQNLKRQKKEVNSREEKKIIRTKAKQLKAELKALEAEAEAAGQEINGGIYIGSGTLIVILLLILLL